MIGKLLTVIAIMSKHSEKAKYCYYGNNCKNFRKGKCTFIHQQKPDVVPIPKVETSKISDYYQAELQRERDWKNEIEADKDKDFYTNQYIKLGVSIKEVEMGLPDELLATIRDYCCKRDELINFPYITHNDLGGLRQFVKCQQEGCRDYKAQMVMVSDSRYCDHNCFICNKALVTYDDSDEFPDSMNNYYLLSVSFSSPVELVSYFHTLHCGGYYSVAGVLLHKQCAPLLGFALPIDNVMKYLRSDIKVLDQKGYTVNLSTIKDQMDGKAATWRLMDTPKSVCFTGSHRDNDVKKSQESAIEWNTASDIHSNYKCFTCDSTFPWYCRYFCSGREEYCEPCGQVGHATKYCRLHGWDRE